MAEEKLPSCPFCGSDDVWLVDIDGGRNAGASYLGCMSCDASSSIRFDHKEILVSNWSERPSGASMQDSVMEKFAAFVGQCNREISCRALEITARIRVLESAREDC